MNTETINTVLDEINSDEVYSSASDIDGIFLDRGYLPERHISEDDLDGIYCLDSDEVNEQTQLEGPDVIEATDSGSSNNGAENLNGKKRKVKIANWQRNISKKKKKYR